MKELTARERFVRVMTGQDVDRVPFMKIFGGTNAVCGTWLEQNPNLHRYIDDLLGFEGKYRGWDITPANFSLVGIPQSIILENTAQFQIIKHGDGTIERVGKGADFHSHIMEYPVKCQSDWELIKEQYLCVDPKKRLPLDWQYYIEMYKNRDYPLQLTSGGVYGFLRTMMGDEFLCYSFYDEPELVKDITSTYISVCTELWELMCRDVQFDLIESWEDMAYNKGSLVSKEIFEKFLSLSFKRIREFADAHNIPVVLIDSDGKIDTLADWMCQSGVNGLYPFEVQSDNDIFSVLNANPKLSAIGCLNKNCMTESKAAIDKEMERAISLIKTGRVIPGPDHFVLNDVPFENYKYFMNSLKQVIMDTSVSSH